MMKMNAFAASKHHDVHAASSSYSQEPSSQMINVDEFRGNNNNRNKKNKKNIDDGRIHRLTC
jgi:hypothetical protein